MIGTLFVWSVGAIEEAQDLHRMIGSKLFVWVLISVLVSIPIFVIGRKFRKIDLCKNADYLRESVEITSRYFKNFIAFTLHWLHFKILQKDDKHKSIKYYGDLSKRFRGVIK